MGKGNYLWDKNCECKTAIAILTDSLLLVTVQ